MGERRKQIYGRLNYDYEHTKPTTSLDHGHKLNKANLKRNCKGQKKRGSRTEIFFGFFVDSGMKTKTKLTRVGGKPDGILEALITT